MSANNWDVCPRCKSAVAVQIEQLTKGLRQAYGKVPHDVYTSMVDDLEDVKRQSELERFYERRTFREDYKIYGADTGVITVSYSGCCTSCGLRLDFEEQHPFYSKPTL